MKMPPNRHASAIQIREFSSTGKTGSSTALIGFVCFQKNPTLACFALNSHSITGLMKLFKLILKNHRSFWMKHFMISFWIF